MKNKYELGLSKLYEVDGTVGGRVIDSLANIAPDVGRYIVEFVFGEIYTRAGLSLQEREMATLASLLTLGSCEAQLEVHINGALNVGIDTEKIIEIFIQSIPYTGFPRVLNAVAVAKKVFAKRKLI